MAWDINNDGFWEKLNQERIDMDDQRRDNTPDMTDQDTFEGMRKKAESLQVEVTALNEMLDTYENTIDKLTNRVKDLEFKHRKVRSEKARLEFTLKQSSKTQAEERMRLNTLAQQIKENTSYILKQMDDVLFISNVNTNLLEKQIKILKKCVDQRLLMGHTAIALKGVVGMLDVWSKNRKKGKESNE